MRAMVYSAYSQIEMQEVEPPAPQPGEAVLKVGAAGICGSEMESFAAQSPRRVPPLIMGHEFSGRIEAVGEGATGLEPGQRVAVNPLIPCDRCEVCRMGRSNACPNRQLIGMNRPGAFAETVAVPASQVFPISESLSYERAALAEPLANGVHAVRLAADPTARNVCVFGAGTIGLLAAQAVKRLGGARVLMADINGRRLELAKVASADETVNSRQTDTKTAADAFTGGRGFDYVVDCAGTSETRRLSAEVVRSGGTAVWIGTHDDETALSGTGAVHGEKRLQGSYGYTGQDFAKALQLLESGEIEIESWTRSLPLEEGVEAFMALLNGRADYVKALLQP